MAAVDARVGRSGKDLTAENAEVAERNIVLLSVPSAPITKDQLCAVCGEKEFYISS
jgi:hypothetical protein